MSVTKLKQHTKGKHREAATTPRTPDTARSHTSLVGIRRRSVRLTRSPSSQRPPYHHRPSGPLAHSWSEPSVGARLAKLVGARWDHSPSPDSAVGEEGNRRPSSHHEQSALVMRMLLQFFSKRDSP